MRGKLTGEDARVNIGPILAQATESGGGRVACRSDVYIIRMRVNVTGDMLVRWPHIGAISGYVGGGGAGLAEGGNSTDAHAPKFGLVETAVPYGSLPCRRAKGVASTDTLGLVTTVERGFRHRARKRRGSTPTRARHSYAGSAHGSPPAPASPLESVTS